MRPFSLVPGFHPLTYSVQEYSVLALVNSARYKLDFNSFIIVYTVFTCQTVKFLYEARAVIIISTIQIA